MILYIGSKKFNFNNDQLEYMYLTEGSEATIYKLKDKVLKVYKEYSAKNRLDEETTEELTTISTRQILMPKEILYDENSNFCGYTNDFIQGYSLKNLGNIKMKDFKEFLRNLEEDKEELSTHYVDLMDLNSDNIIYNGNIFLCDPGSFIIREDKDVKEIKKINNFEINRFICQELLEKARRLSKKQKGNIIKHFGDYEDISDKIIAEAEDDNEKLRTYVKRITM